jgi:hypothetical protein
LHAVLDLARFQVRIAQALGAGPPYRSRLDRIIIDLTHCCDLRCCDCNRSCAPGQAPAAETIGLEQVRRFVGESVAAGKRWRRIWLEGGEPTLHPQLDEILEELLRFRRDHVPECRIVLCSNGHGERARRVIARLPAGVDLKNSAKSADPRQGHAAFNVAPADVPAFAGADFSQGCYIHPIFGLGLTRAGYYPHPICGGIDRVFGFDVGLKRLPRTAEELAGQMRRLCPLCGHFREFRPAGRPRSRAWQRGGGDFPPGSMSRSWLAAYRAFRERPPALSPY